MAKTRVVGLKITGRSQSLPIDKERWDVLGPTHTKWVNLHVYWVLPLGVVLIMWLALGASGVFDQKEVVKTVLVEMPKVASNSQPAPAGRTIADIMLALKEYTDLLKAGGQVRIQQRVMAREEVQPLTPPPPTPVEKPKPEAPAKPPSIWDINK